MDVSKFFELDYGLNLNWLFILVNFYEVFKCDVLNMSILLFFVVNDVFYNQVFFKFGLFEGVIFGSLRNMVEQYLEFVKKYYGKLVDILKDVVMVFNIVFVQDGVLMYVLKNVIVDRFI